MSKVGAQNLFTLIVWMFLPGFVRRSLALAGLLAPTERRYCGSSFRTDRPLDRQARCVANAYRAPHHLIVRSAAVVGLDCWRQFFAIWRQI
jgi:hypothetical protein